MENEPDEAIITAAIDNNLEAMREAIERGVDVNFQDFFGKTALHYIESIEAGQL